MKKITSLLILVLIMSNSIFAQKEKELVDYTNFDTSLTKELLVREINRFRAKHNLKPFVMDSTTEKVAQYDASYVNETLFPKSYEEMDFNYFHNIPFEGVLLKTPNDRMDYFSSLNRVNRRLFYCMNTTGFSRSDFTETYYNFAITTLLTILQTYDQNFDEVLKYNNSDGEEFVGIGISFKEMIGGVQKGYEVYVNIAISTDK